MKKRILTIAIVLMMSIFTLALYVSADFGNFDTYDSSGSSYGGGYSSSGSDYSSSSWDDDYGNYDYYDYGDSDYEFNEEDAPYIIIVFIIIVVVVVLKMRKSSLIDKERRERYLASQKARQEQGQNQSFVSKTTQIENAIRENDPAFTSGKFIAYAKESYVKLQSAWTARDLEQLRVLMTDELFAQSKTQIEEYIRLGRINVMERVAVNSAFLSDYRRDDSKEYLDVVLNATQKDYIIDETTKAVLEGSTTNYRSMSYVMTFMRSVGSVTTESDGVTAANCPNCGAPIEVSAAGKCAYCGSVISSDSHAWVISEMKRNRR